MKRLNSAYLVLVLFLVLPAAAQRSSSQPSALFSRKASVFSGTISDDGHFVVADRDLEVWTVINPEALKGREGKSVTLQVQTVAGAHELRVLSVRTASRENATSLAKWSDSAFRR